MTRAELLDLISREPLLGRVLARVREDAQHDPAHDVDHLLRVAIATLKIDPVLDPVEAVCAALLHDVVNLPKDHPERALASARSAGEARRLLAGALSDDAIERVAAAIEDHSFSAGRVPRSPLGEALQDADRLEALGALGIARTFSTGVRMGARYFDPEDPWAVRRDLDDKAFSVDHFFTKLLRLPETFRTKLGREEAERRVAIMRSFLDAMGEEIGSPRRGACRCAAWEGTDPSYTSSFPDSVFETLLCEVVGDYHGALPHRGRLRCRRCGATFAYRAELSHTEVERESQADRVIAALRAGREAQVGGGRSFATYVIRENQPLLITSDDGFTEELPITESRLRELIEEHANLFADYLRHWSR